VIVAVIANDECLAVAAGTNRSVDDRAHVSRVIDVDRRLHGELLTRLSRKHQPRDAASDIDVDAAVAQARGSESRISAQSEQVPAQNDPLRRTRSA